MSSFAFFGALEYGLIYGLVGLGVFITFRLLEFPDLTVEGSFPLGAAVAASWIVSGGDPWSGLALGALAGAVAGLATAFLAVRCGIIHIVASILTMIALFSINIRIMGRPNIALLGVDTIMDFFPGSGEEIFLRTAACAAVVVPCAALLIRFLLSDAGLAFRATGANPRMMRTLGVDTRIHIYGGLALSNALVGLAGGLFAQIAGFADVTSGVGTIVFGLAAVILGEALAPGRSMLVLVCACIIGSLAYRLFVAFALSAGVFGLQASDLNLVTAALVAVALMAPRLRRMRLRTRKTA